MPDDLPFVMTGAEVVKLCVYWFAIGVALATAIFGIVWWINV